MKAILEFNLPEDHTEHRQAINGGLWESVLWELDQDLRSTVKWGDDKTKAEYAEKIREKIYELMSDHNLSWSA